MAEEELAAVLDAQQEVRRAMHSVQSSRRLDEQQQEQQQHHLDQAEAGLKKLRLLAHGPVIPKVTSHSSLLACCFPASSARAQQF